MAASSTPSSTSIHVSGNSNLKVRLTAPAPNVVAHSTYQVVGIVLAVISGCLIGSSFVFKKKGLLRSQAGHTAGKGVAYLKSVRLPGSSPSFTLFLTLTSHYGGLACPVRPLLLTFVYRVFMPCQPVMIVGELCNFAGSFFVRFHPPPFTHLYLQLTLSWRLSS
jgi:hypothetical protein